MQTMQTMQKWRKQGENEAFMPLNYPQDTVEGLRVPGQFGHLKKGRDNP